jgi:hypothetical protein
MPVHAEGEPELREAFDRTLKARALGGEAEVADRWFFETAGARSSRRRGGAPSPA